MTWRWFALLALGLAQMVMAIGYTYSGATKLTSPSWVDGSALRYVLENPLARPNALRAFLLGADPLVLQVMTYAVLGLELLTAPLCLFGRLRPLVWIALTSMHIGILALVDFADLTVAMLLLHAYTFDPAWLAGLSTRPPADAAMRAGVMRREIRS